MDIFRERIYKKDLPSGICLFIIHHYSAILKNSHCLICEITLMYPAVFTILVFLVKMPNMIFKM